MLTIKFINNILVLFTYRSLKIEWSSAPACTGRLHEYHISLGSSYSDITLSNV